ncbi:hypothetical protein CB0940_03868 [Cercospora beticola]|uniref:Zn(2)-C6 fungal-type domain-containing protein n=1 Tax=Cercospora beticola TaxID=122368 RepID=A0A2G5HMC1_CERBT|nr:hypothetical protein CB0940_03868 [Cercospora beticola]PIA93699.1 hypothetical protein CB0940_03868 [Cercospora beticola]WPB01068.1 hypothetical protein RHO25_005688 [Cercospora beticola]
MANGMEGREGRPGPQKRSKRTPYAAKACYQCQQRKIKCEGGLPCRNCSIKGRECFLVDEPPAPARRASTPRRDEIPGNARNKRRSSHHSSSTNANSSHITTTEVYQRLLNVEQRLNASLSQSAWASSSNGDLYSAAAITDHASPETCHDNARGRQTFVGEASVRNEDDEISESPTHSPIANRRPLTPTISSHDERNSRGSTTWLTDVLSSFDVRPDSLDCKGLLNVFFDEVAMIYPFIHRPCVWKTFEYLWSRSLQVTLEDLEAHGESKLTVALLFMCIALGRCTASPRTPSAEAAHSAGWSIYNVAVELMRPYLDVTSDSPPSLHSLQALTMMVIYLFRLDACERAERTLAHVISSAHILGIYRTDFYVNMCAFDEEMFRRLWWCIYLQDRRMSLESSRPFLIQDSNIEIGLPLDVSDAWLEAYRRTSTSIASLQGEIEKEKSLEKVTILPYLEAHVSQSRIAADVWRAVYNSKQASFGSSSMVSEYLDTALDSWRQEMPTRMQYQESGSFEEQFSNVPWWQAKQSMLLYVRYCLLKAIIRRTPKIPRDGSTNREQLPVDMQCAQLAAAVIRVYEKIPQNRARQSFAFIHPMTSATMILHSLVSLHPGLRDPYEAVLRTGIDALVAYCQSTWVSGKMIRTTFRLNALVQRTLGVTTERGDGVRDKQGQDQFVAQQSQNMPSGPASQRRSSSLVDAQSARPQPAPIRGLLSPPVSTASAAQRNDLAYSEKNAEHITEFSWNPLHDTDENAMLSLSQSDFSSLELPDWATLDFDFEHAGNRHAANGASQYSSGDLFGFEGWATM